MSNTQDSQSNKGPCVIFASGLETEPHSFPVLMVSPSQLAENVAESLQIKWPDLEFEVRAGVDMSDSECAASEAVWKDASRGNYGDRHAWVTDDAAEISDRLESIGKPSGAAREKNDQSKPSVATAEIPAIDPLPTLTESQAPTVDGNQNVPGLRYEKAFQSYNMAIAAEELTNGAFDREAHDWLKEHGLDEYELPEFDTWQRYVRKARSFYQAQKNSPVLVQRL
jgi:hypothetical protein